MKLSISNIAWNSECDEEMYLFLKEQGFNGLEIAPTRIFPLNPYEHCQEAAAFAEILHNEYGLAISSMQSIWFGKGETIFGSDRDRQVLLDYTFKAINFAEVIGCPNLVFGCPKNRNIPNNADMKIAYDFFGDIARYAKDHGTVMAIEPNPPIYDTNFINDSTEAFRFAEEICGLAVNLDFGTIIENSESLQVVSDNLDLINHIHISEPYLAKIEERDLHVELSKILKNGNYQKYISIEMKNPGGLLVVKQTADYIRRVFG
ncbi:MAG: sugar phosphate isomerase/epimerase [Lachnospiraceae bacterium]|nr:sugar phosphate isomerase/epimerase [Lachnospiraceae bacterium]